MAVEKYQTKLINNDKDNATANRHLAPFHKVKGVDILDGVIGNQKKVTIQRLNSQAGDRS